MKSIFNENCVITRVAIFLLELLYHVYNSPPIASHRSNSNEGLYCNSIIQDLNYQFQNKSCHSKGKAGLFHCLETVEEDRFTYKFRLLILSTLFSLWEKQFSDGFTNSLILHCPVCQGYKKAILLSWFSCCLAPGSSRGSWALWLQPCSNVADWFSTL